MKSTLVSRLTSRKTAGSSQMLLTALLLLLASSAFSETIMSPRTKAEHDADMKRMYELYGPKQDAKLQSQVQAQAANNDGAMPSIGAARPVTAAPRAEAPINSPQPAPKAATATSVASAQKVRAELSASGADRFKFAGKIYTRAELEPVLRDLAASYALDHLVLLDTGDAIQLTHLVELSKLSEALKKPAVYQSGDQFKAVN